MILSFETGSKRITEAQITALADDLVSLLYLDQSHTHDLQAQLYDLSRSGSFCAMRELLAHYSLSEDERDMLKRILSENQII